MTLEEKGKIQPPPVLSEFPQKVSIEIQSWTDITAATHWEIYDAAKVNGADFYIGKDELGHIHLDGEVHILFGKTLAALLIKSKLAKKFPYGNDWIISPVDSADDVLHATWLFKLNYNRIKGKSLEELIIDIENYSKIKI